MIVRAVRPEDREQWQPLWDGYNLFYERVLPGEITEVTWARFFDPDEPVLRRRRGARLESSSGWSITSTTATRR